MRFPYLLIELFYIGMPVVRSLGRCTVTWLPNFLGWVDYFIFWPMVVCAPELRSAFIWSEIVKDIWKHSARPLPYLSEVPRNISGHDALFSSDVQKWAVILEEMAS